MIIIKRRRLFILIFLLIQFVIFFSLSDGEILVREEITNYLNDKKYDADSREYNESDLNVSSELERILRGLGVTPYTIIRNEIFARHGYNFKSNLLKKIFESANWYKPDRKAGLNSINKTEALNVNFIKKIEDTYDFDNIAEFLSKKSYKADYDIYKSNSDLNIPQPIQFSLNHLSINPTRLFRNEIFARHGYIFKDQVLNKIFNKVNWYKERNSNAQEIAKEFSKDELVNIALLMNREWLDILDSVKFTVPSDITIIPAKGMNAIFIKSIPFNGENYYYSYINAWSAMEEKGSLLNNHDTDVENLISDAVIKKIKKEKNYTKKLILFFQNKKYKGYVDKTAFNHSDMEVPSYLADALESLKINWKLILRKEIHARNGAVFIDPKTGPIFRSCTWYKARYNLTPFTLTRFPKNVKISGMELNNYSLLEGEELISLYKKYKTSENINIALDFQGNVYFVKIETVNLDLSGNNTITLGHGFSSLKQAEEFSVEYIIRDLFKNMKVDPNEIIESTEEFDYGGC